MLRTASTSHRSRHLAPQSGYLVALTQSSLQRVGIDLRKRHYQVQLAAFARDASSPLRAKARPQITA
jgi:hypothetical protein